MPSVSISRNPPRRAEPELAPAWISLCGLFQDDGLGVAKVMPPIMEEAYGDGEDVSPAIPLQVPFHRSSAVWRLHYALRIQQKGIT